LENTKIKKIIESLIFSSTSPISLKELANFFSEENIPIKIIEQIINEIQEKYSETGVILNKVSTGYRFQVSEDCNQWVSKFYPEKPQKYSRALMETLALIIYKQPITRTEIEAVRGVSVSSNIIKTLLEREWIKILGYKDVPGKPAIFGTTKEFLNSHNLVSLSQLPKLDDIIELTEQEKKQLGLLDIEKNTEENIKKNVNSDMNNDEEYNNDNIH
jgi:segregation and condensation protein B